MWEKEAKDERKEKKKKREEERRKRRKKWKKGRKTRSNFQRDIPDLWRVIIKFSNKRPTLMYENSGHNLINLSNASRALWEIVAIESRAKDWSGKKVYNIRSIFKTLRKRLSEDGNRYRIWKVFQIFCTRL